MAEGTTVLNMPRLMRKLQASVAVFEVAAVEALTAAADEIVALMKEWVPVRSGKLRDSIGWTFGDAPKGSVIVMKGRGRRRGKAVVVTIYAGRSVAKSDAFYARFVEFGTAPHTAGGMFKGAQHPGATAHPFFFPAWRLKKKKLKGRVGREMRKSAKQIAAVA